MRLGPAPVSASVPAGKGRRHSRQHQYSASETQPNYGSTDFSHEAQYSTSSSSGPRPCFDVGFHEPSGGYPRPPPELLPWCPRGPDEVCKTYSHIFKLLNDPQLRKKIPKQKPSIHVSMPRLPAAGLAIARSSHDVSWEDDPGGQGPASMADIRSKKMPSSHSAPDLHSSGRVQLPPLAQSAGQSELTQMRVDPLGAGMPRTVVAGGTR
jgi:hypothetical protein